MFTGMTHTDGLRPTVNRRRALQLAGAAAGVLGAGVAGLPWAATAWAGPAVAAPATGFGLFEDLQYLTGTALTDRLDEFVRLGVGWARFQLIWANVQRYSPDSFDWGPSMSVRVNWVRTAAMPQPMSTPTAAGMIAPSVGITDPTVDPLPRCASGISARCG